MKVYTEQEEKIYKLCMTVWKQRHDKLREQNKRIIKNTKEVLEEIRNNKVGNGQTNR